MTEQRPRTDADGMPWQPEPTFLGTDDVDKLCGLVFELAGQVHELTARVMRLEAAADGPDSDAPTLADETRRSLDGLMAVLLERNDMRGPLRHEAPTTDVPTTTEGSPT